MDSIKRWEVRKKRAQSSNPNLPRARYSNPQPQPTLIPTMQWCSCIADSQSRLQCHSFTTLRILVFVIISCFILKLCPHVSCGDFQFLPLFSLLSSVRLQLIPSLVSEVCVLLFVRYVRCLPLYFFFSCMITGLNFTLGLYFMFIVCYFAFRHFAPLGVWFILSFSC